MYSSTEVYRYDCEERFTNMENNQPESPPLPPSISRSPVSSRLAAATSSPAPSRTQALKDLKLTIEYKVLFFEAFEPNILILTQRNFLLLLYFSRDSI